MLSVLGKVMGLIFGPNRVIAKDVKRCTFWLLCQMRDINSRNRNIEKNKLSFNNFLAIFTLIFFHFAYELQTNFLRRNVF